MTLTLKYNRGATPPQGNALVSLPSRRPAEVSSCPVGCRLFGGRASIPLARDIPARHIPNMPKATRSKGPRAEHPRLVGFSDKENALVERAAAKAEFPTNVYIREAALYAAREELGLKQPGGE